MDEKLYIPIILGTVRQGNQSQHVANYIFKKAQEREDIETVLFDPKKMKLDFSDEGQALKDKHKDYRDAIIKADGLIVVFPEYNHGYPATLKHILDIMLPEYIHKPVSFVGISQGMFGGARGIENLVNVVRELGLVATFSDLYFPKVQDTFNDQGELVDPKVNNRVEDFFNELAWMAKTLKYGRQNIPSKHHQQ